MTDNTTVTNHTYEGDGGPCRAEAYGQTCDAPGDAHQLDEGPAPLSPEHDAPICTQETARAAGLDVAPSPSELAAVAASIIRSWGDRHAEPNDETASVADAGAQLARAVPLLLDEVTRLRAELNQAHDDRTGACLARWEEEQDNARLRLALASAQRGRQEARTRIAELERMNLEPIAAALAERFATDNNTAEGMRYRFEGPDGWPASRDVTPAEAAQVAIDAIRELRGGEPGAVSTPCSVPDPCADGELCDRHETEQAHAAGDHGNCGVTCSTEFPTEALRNFVIAKGYPGTTGALDELLRRAAAPDAERDRVAAALAEVLRLVSAWCVEANENGGVDAGDLAWRLEQAGHPLPDEEQDGADAAEGSAR